MSEKRFSLKKIKTAGRFLSSAVTFRVKEDGRVEVTRWHYAWLHEIESVKTMALEEAREEWKRLIKSGDYETPRPPTPETLAKIKALRRSLLLEKMRRRKELCCDHRRWATICGITWEDTQDILSGLVGEGIVESLRRGDAVHYRIKLEQEA